MNRYLIITTVGTSLFTNYIKEEIRNSFEDYKPIDFGDWEKKKLTAEDYGQPGNDFSNMESIIENDWLTGKKKLGQDWIPDEEAPNRHASAEITSILKIAEKIKEENQDAKIEVKLLATDTALSVSAAKLISLFPFSQFDITLEPQGKQGFDPQNDYIPSLGVHPPGGQNESQYYDEGLQQLVEILIGKEGLIKEVKKHKRKPIINFSGGYKAIIPYLTIISQLEDIPMYYIYEESDYLMEVGSLPVNFDWGVIEIYHPYLDDALLSDPNQHEESGYNEKTASFLARHKLIRSLGNSYCLTPLGNVIKSYLDRETSSKPSIFGEYMETKIHEFYTDCYRLKNTLPDEGGKIVELPLRAIKFKKGKDNGDYDLLLVKNHDKRLNLIACEIKSVSNIRENQKEKLKDQFRKYSECFDTLFEFENKSLSEIRLYIHKLPFQTQFLNQVISILIEFKEYVENGLGKKFSVFTVDAKVKGDKIDYHGFLKEKLAPDSIRHYELKSGNHA